MKNIEKQLNNIFYALILIIVCACFLISPKYGCAQDGVQVWGEGDIAKTAIEEQTGMRAQDPRITIVNIIRIGLGFLGIIAVIIIIYAGYLWMTAGGNAEQIEKAKMLMRNAAIGLAIILSSFAIVSFILSKLIAATGGDGGLEGQLCKEGDASRICGCGGLMSCSKRDEEWRWSGCAGSDCGGDSFKINSTSPKNEAVNVIRNAKIRVYFNNVVDEVSVKAATFAVKSGDNDVEGTIAVNGRVIEFTPSLDCPVDSCAGAGAKCFSEKMNVAVVAVSPNSLTNTPGIKSADGKNLECTGAMCSFSFTTGSVIDCESPEAELIAPGQICAETEHKFGVNSSDVSSSVERIEFYVNGTKDGEAVNGAGANPFNIAPTDDNAFTWDSAGYSEKSVSLKVTAFDMDDHSASDAKIMQIRSAHCCNGVKDADEKSIDCGGADCAACRGAACGVNMNLACGDNNCDNAKCASGFCNCGVYSDGTASDDSCQEKGYSASVANQCCVCEEKPEIYWIKEPNGAPGNLVTIGGRNFGATQGIGKVEFIKDGNIISASLANEVNNQCLGAWSDTRIIAEIPKNTIIGEYEVRVTANTGFSDSEKFTVNTTERPGLCLAYKEISGVKKSEGKFEEETNLAGINLSDINNRDEIFFGNSKADISSNINGVATLIQGAVVPNLTGGGLTVFVKDIDGEKSNPVDFTILESSKTPRIYGFEPKAGHSGDYVRIWGQGFGAAQGGSNVYFIDSSDTETAASYSFPDECLASYWSDNQIIVKVPGGLAGGESYTIKVQKALDGEGTLDITNEDKFYFGDYCSDDFAACGSEGACNTDSVDCIKSVSPGLCKISPIMGPAKTPVDFYGENFGADIGKAEFNGEKEVEDPNDSSKMIKGVEKIQVTPSNWTKGTGGGADIAKANVPIEDPADNMPITPITGQIKIISALSMESYGLRFEVGSCEADAQCNISGGSTSFVCCGDNTLYKGACMENQNACGFVLNPPTDYIWSFSTESPTVINCAVDYTSESACNSSGYCCWFDESNVCASSECPASLVPTVKNQCDQGVDCNKDAVGPSPSPSKQWPNGDAACVDSVIRAEFSTNIVASTLNDTTIKVYECGDTENSCDNAATLVVGAIESSVMSFSFTPSANLKQNTWHKVILKANQGIKAADKDGQVGKFLDGDGDGIPGEDEQDDFIWTFKTRNDNTPCEIGCAFVNPAEYTAPNTDLIKYTGNLRAKDNVCELLRDRGETWEWDSDKYDFAAISAQTGCCADITGYTCSEHNNWKCVEPKKETEIDDPVEIKGTVKIDGSNLPDTAKLYIDFSDFSVESFWPNCNDSCLNAAVGARFSGATNDTSLTIENKIFLYKCGTAKADGSGCDTYSQTAITTTKSVVNVVNKGKVDFSANDYFAPSTFYRAVIKGGAGGVRSAEGGGLDGLNYSTVVSGAKDAFSWEFKTGAKSCEVDTVSVEPAYGVVGQIGAGLMYSAEPKTVPDICNGQKLDAYSYDWKWTDGAAFASVSDYPECGNGIVEKGEDCDPSVRGNNASSDAEWTRMGCSDSCQNVGNTKKCGASAVGCCGNGVKDEAIGEECDGEEWCSDKCLLKGSNVSYNSFCGNGGALESGEECELGEQGCSSICLWMGTAACMEDGDVNCCGNGSRERWEECDDGDNDNSDGCSSVCLREGVGACSGECCGNGRIDEGEDCDEGKRVEGKDGEDGREGNDGTVCSAICTNAGTVACSGSVNKDCCGNGVIEAGEDCDEGALNGKVKDGENVIGCSSNCVNAGTVKGSIATSMPYQFVKAIDGPAAGQTAATTDVTATEAASLKFGTGKFTIQCGYQNDSQCPAGRGVGNNGCCYPRPIVVSPLKNLENICPNGVINNVVFDQIMDKNGLEKAAILEKNNGDEECGEVLGDFQENKKAKKQENNWKKLEIRNWKFGNWNTSPFGKLRAGSNLSLVRRGIQWLFDIFIGNGLISFGNLMRRNFNNSPEEGSDPLGWGQTPRMSAGMRADNLKTTPQGMALNTSSAIADVSAAIHDGSITHRKNMSSDNIQAIPVDSTGLEPAFPQVDNRGACQLAELPMNPELLSNNYSISIYPESIFYLLKFAERALVQSFTDVKTHLAGLVNFAKAQQNVETWCKVGQKIISRTNTAEIEAVLSGEAFEYTFEDELGNEWELHNAAIQQNASNSNKVIDITKAGNAILNKEGRFYGTWEMDIKHGNNFEKIFFERGSEYLVAKLEIYSNENSILGNDNNIRWFFSNDGKNDENTSIVLAKATLQDGINHIKINSDAHGIMKLHINNTIIDIDSYDYDFTNIKFAAGNNPTKNDRSSQFDNIKYTPIVLSEVVPAGTGTIATIMPTALLESGAEYRLSFDGLKSISGVAVADTAYANKIKVSARSEICLIDRVDVYIDKTFPDEPTADDIFICAGRDDCGAKTETTLDDDINSAAAGNQHLYRAYALDKDGNELAADFTWLEHDSYPNQGAISIEGNYLSQKYVTAFPLEEAKASVEIGAYDGYGYDSAATLTVDIQLYMCENPWPPISEFPYEDSEYNFSTYVCLDAGAENDAADNFTGFGKTCSAGIDKGKHCEDSNGCANTGICASGCVAGTENANNDCSVDTDCGDVECKINPIGSYKVCHTATVNGGRRCSADNECGNWNEGCGFTCAGGVNQGKMCDVVDDCPDGSCAGTCYDWTFKAGTACTEHVNCWSDDLPITKDPKKCETKVLKEYLWVEE